MLITTPAEITNILYEGPLEFRPSADGRLGQREDSGLWTELAEGESPVVTVGEPQVWNIAEVYQIEALPLPASISLLLREADFFLVRLACSFRPGRRTHLEWARFAVNLSALNPAAPDPVALDLHPLELYDQMQRNVHIKLSPALKFTEIEATIGEVGLELQYNELIPVITAVGVQERNFSWELQETEQHPLRGARWFHTMLKRPRGAGGIIARFEVVTDAVTSRGLLRAALREQERTRLSRVICT
jgi:hypothetical protein